MATQYGTAKVKIILAQLTRSLLSRASPWLIRFRIVPTISATTIDRRGTPSETQHWQTFRRRRLGPAAAGTGRPFAPAQIARLLTVEDNRIGKQRRRPRQSASREVALAPHHAYRPPGT